MLLHNYSLKIIYVRWCKNCFIIFIMFITFYHSLLNSVLYKITNLNFQERILRERILRERKIIFFDGKILYVYFYVTLFNRHDESFFLINVIFTNKSTVSKYYKYYKYYNNSIERLTLRRKIYLVLSLSALAVEAGDI